MVDSIEVRVSALEGEVKDIKSTCKDINDRLIRMEESLKSSKDKIVNLENNTRAIMEMSTNVRILTDKVSDMLAKIDKQDDRLENLEDKPGNVAIKGWVLIATTLITTAVGAIVGILMKGGF